MSARWTAGGAAGGVEEVVSGRSDRASREAAGVANLFLKSRLTAAFVLSSSGGGVVFPPSLLLSCLVLSWPCFALLYALLSNLSVPPIRRVEVMKKVKGAREEKQEEKEKRGEGKR